MASDGFDYDARSGSASESPASGSKPRLLIAYDGSDLAAAAVRSAAELFPGSAALVVTVWEPGLAAMAAVDPGLYAAGIAPVQVDPELVSELDTAGEQHAAVVAREGAQLAGSLGLDAQPHAIPDEVHVADTIVDLAIERDVAAVVVGSQGISGLRSRLLGSTSRQILKRCRCPVVVIRPPEDH
jgi:nucleotide-binding universal stress UspA family protein